METSKSVEDKELVFSSQALRLVVGAIAFFLPWVVVIVTLTILPSISASYHTKVRDIFVGALFVIGTLFVAYNGHAVELQDEQLGKFWNWLSRFWPGAKDFRKLERRFEERAVSLVGGLAAIFAAVYPTAQQGYDPDLKAKIHGIAAAILFLGVVYFCLVGFLDRVRPALYQPWSEGGKAKLRAWIYLVCGWGIALTMLAAVIAPFVMTASVAQERAVLFWAETVALWLFGVAWLTASKFLRFLVDDESEQFKIIDVKARKIKRPRMQANA